MNNQKKLTLRSLILTIALVLPLIYFGYAIIFSSQNSNYIPKYNFLYITQTNKSECFVKYNQPTTNQEQQPPITGQQTFKYINVVNNRVTLTETEGNNNSGYTNGICNEDFYYYDVSSNTSKIVKPDALANYELINNGVDSNNEQKDPDGFQFKDTTNNNNIIPFFYERYDYDRPSYSLTKKFSIKNLNIQGGRIKLIGFLKN